MTSILSGVRLLNFWITPIATHSKQQYILETQPIPVLRKKYWEEPCEMGDKESYQVILLAIYNCPKPTQVTQSNKHFTKLTSKLYRFRQHANFKNVSDINSSTTLMSRVLITPQYVFSIPCSLCTAYFHCFCNVNFSPH